MSAWKGMLLMLVTFAFCAVATEAGLRVLGKWKAPDPPQPIREWHYVADADVGYHLWPSTQSCLRWPPHATRLTESVTNSDGFRSSRELGDRDPRPRVLVVGDSFTEGVGVEEGERYTEILEDRTGWRVDNAGIAGWGVGQMVRTVDAFATKAKADVVVLAIYVDDLRRAHPLYTGYGYGVDGFVLEAGRLVNRPFETPSGWRRLRLVHGISRLWTERDPLFLDVNRALVARFAELAERDGFIGVTAFLPGRNPEAKRDRAAAAMLAEAAAEHALPHADLTNAILEADDPLYLDGDPHWNPTGHRIAGEALARRLSDAIGDTLSAGPDATLADFVPTPWRTTDISRCHTAGES